jgi:hypothetical protein
LLRDLPVDHLDLQQPGEKAAFSMSSPKANALQRALAHCSLFCRDGHRLTHQARQTEICPAPRAAFAFSEGKEIK